MTDRAFHAVADLFPLMREDELQALADDIKANGLQIPIVVDADGNILDGRHRFLACEMAGVEPEYCVTTSTDLVALVASLNAQRRNITPAQKAMAAAAAWEMVDTKRGPKGNSGKTSLNGQRRDHLGAMFGVNGKYVEQAHAISETDKALAAQVRVGTKKLGDAYDEVKRRARDAEGDEKQLERLRKADPDLAVAVVAGEMTLPQAFAILHNRAEETRLRQVGAMRVIHQALSFICPAIDDPDPLIDQLWSNWSEEHYPEEQPKLTVANLRNSARVLSELADRMEANTTKRRK
jgi:ParB-like nuclease domain